MLLIFLIFNCLEYGECINCVWDVSINLRDVVG